MELIDYIKEKVNDESLNILPYLVSDIDKLIEIMPSLTDKEYVSISEYFLTIIDNYSDSRFVDAIENRFLEIKDNSYDLYSIYQIIKYGMELYQEEY